MGRKPKYSKEIKIKACKDYKLGKCIDNNPMEGFFGILKTEMFYGKSFSSMEELIEKIKEYILFYNEERFQKKLKCLAPLEYRHQALVANF